LLIVNNKTDRLYQRRLELLEHDARIALQRPPFIFAGARQVRIPPGRKSSRRGQPGFRPVEAGMCWASTFTAATALKIRRAARPKYYVRFFPGHFPRSPI
jgi:hypothetical protein